MKIFILFFILSFINVSLAQSELDEAISWLNASQHANGYWGTGVFVEHWTASGLIALYEADEPAAGKASNWLKQQLEDLTSVTWSADEAGIPAIIIYSFYVTLNETEIDIVNTSEKLKTFQNTDNASNGYGGFRGFKENGQTPVESSIDTAFSLLALVNYENFSTEETNAALNFLKRLQNADGSFNLTFNTTYHTLYSLGPDPISLTAVAVLALSEMGEDTTQATEFLKKSARACFGNDNRSYSVAAAAIAFNEVGEPEYAEAATNYLKLLQKSDGGFADSTRSDPSTANALDTAWAALALVRIGDNTTADVCAPLEASMDVKNTVVQPGEAQNISLNLTGAISSTVVKITRPNGNISQFILGYNVNNTAYEITFNDTNQTGEYNVTAEIKPIFGETVFLEDFFSSEVPSTTTTTTTTAPAATTTTPPAGGGGATPVALPTTTSTTTTSTTTVTALIGTVQETTATIGPVTGEVVGEAVNITGIGANQSQAESFTGQAVASPVTIGISILIIAGAALFIYKKLKKPKLRKHRRRRGH